MANKEKLLASAHKFLAKGQVSKAVSEYQQLVDAFPKDVRNRLKLAELCSRDNRNDEALKQYELVANHYTETGFYLKSIAVFKQMQKIEPSRVDIYHRLAELNEKQGLVGNALSEYRNLVAFYEKNVMPREAIEVLEKMSRLDPENLNVSAKIAECYKSDGQNAKAFERFQSIIQLLAEKQEFTKIIKLYDRFLEVCPEEAEARLPLARALLSSNQYDKAIQFLKNLLKQIPESPEVIRILVDAYVATQDFTNARLTLKHLLKQGQTDLSLREYYIRICLDAGDFERARNRLEEWKDDFFQAERISSLQSVYEELKVSLPGDSIVIATLAAIYEAVGETGKLNNLDMSAVTVESFVETAESAVFDDAISDVEELEMVGEEAAPDVEVPPLDEVAPKPAPVATGLELELDLDLDLDLAPAAESTETASAPVETEVEVELDLDSIGELDLELEEAPLLEVAEPSEADDDQLVVDVSPEEAEIEVDLDFDDMGELDLELEEEPVDAPVEAEEDQLSLDVVADESEILEIDLPAEISADESVPESPEVSLTPSGEIEFSLDLETELEPVTEPVEAVATFEEPQNVEAVKTLEDVVAPEEIEEFEALEEVEELEEIEELETLEEVEELEEIEELEILEEVEGLAEDFAAALNVDAELEEAEFYLQQGLYDDAHRVIQTLMEYRPEMPELQVKLDEVEEKRQAEESSDESVDFVDFMADIQDDELFGATDFLDALDSDVGTSDEFSQELATDIDSGDTESHYNLGIAYKEMGLYDDAIEEFEKAIKDPVRLIDCISLIGQCHVEAGANEAALAAFRNGLSQETITDEGRMTLNFELGLLFQSTGQMFEALETFQLVAEKDSFFRDVGKTIQKLRKDLGLEDESDDDGPQGNRDRVSYV